MVEQQPSPSPTPASAPRRPKSLLALLLFFCWVDARALGWIIFPNTSASHHFYVALDQLWLHYVLQAVTIAFAATATGYLWRPIAGWFESSMVGLVVFGLTTVGGAWYTVRHLDVARSSYAASRERRGFPATPEQLAGAFTPEFIWASALTMVAILLVLAALAWRNRAFAADVEDT